MLLVCNSFQLKDSFGMHVPSSNIKHRSDRHILDGLRHHLSLIHIGTTANEQHVHLALLRTDIQLCSTAIHE